MTRTTAPNPYPSRCLLYSHGKHKIFLLDVTEDESLAKISAEHPEAVVVYGSRFWAAGKEAKYKDIKNELEPV